MNLKLKTIYSMILSNWKIILDVGCDHAFLSQKNYLDKSNKHFINLDNKKGPLDNAIKNHEHIENDAEFILQEGKDFMQSNNRDIDCCIIAGIGGLNCLEILNVNNKYIHNYILQVDNNQDMIDEWIINNKWKIKEIKNLVVNKVNYLIYRISKNENDE